MKYKQILASLLAASMLVLSTPLYSFAANDIEDIQTTEAEESIEDAIKVVDGILNQDLAIAPDVLEDIKSDLQEGANNISEISGNLEIVVEILDDLPTIDDASKEIQNAEGSIQTYENLDDITTTEANETIKYTEIANTTDSEEEAYKAKDDAIQTLDETEKDLAKAENAFDTASKAVDAIDIKYQEALKQQEEIQGQLEKAQAELEEAGINSQEANDNLKAAQEKMDQIDAEVIQLAQSKESLQALKDQYYRFIVHFYRDNGINSAIYNEDGSLNTEKSAEKALENDKVVDPKVSENTLKVGRELMKDLIFYKLEANGAEDIQFATQEKGLSKKQSADGELTEDNKGNDKVVIKETQDQYWSYPSGDSGRHHSVKVTYTLTDKDGNKQEVTEYYNYIYKAEKYNDTMDLVNGPIYLAKIDPVNNGIEKDTDSNNKDNYVALTEELENAINVSILLEKYNKAKDAVDVAQSKVETLNNQIQTLLEEKLTFEDTQVKKLADELKKAKDELQRITEEKEVLEAKVEEARKAVAGISLDRFNVAVDVPEEATEQAPPQNNDAIVNNVIVPQQPQPQPVVVNNDPITIENEEVALAETINQEGNENKEEPILTDITNELSPLSEEIEKSGSNFLFLYILLIILLIIILLIIYIKDRINENKKG